MSSPQKFTKRVFYILWPIDSTSQENTTSISRMTYEALKRTRLKATSGRNR